MVQFLSIIFFFLDFFNFCWGFQKFPFFCVILYKKKCSKEMEIFIFGYLSYVVLFTEFLFLQDLNGTPIFYVTLLIREAICQKTEKTA